MDITPFIGCSIMPSLDVLSRDRLVIPSFQKVEYKVKDLIYDVGVSALFSAAV